MDYFIRLVGFILRIVVSVLVRVSILLLRAFRPIGIAVARRLFNMMRTSIMAAIMGPTAFIDRQASDWTRRLLAIGMSRDHIDIAHDTSRIVITGMIVMGWVVTALFMVTMAVIFLAVIRVVFGIFI